MKFAVSKTLPCRRQTLRRRARARPPLEFAAPPQCPIHLYVLKTTTTTTTRCRNAFDIVALWWCMQAVVYASGLFVTRCV